MEINNQGIIYHFEKDENEINDMFYERCWKAAKLQPKNEDELSEAIKISKLWAYKKYYNCIYSDEIEKKIETIFN